MRNIKAAAAAGLAVNAYFDLHFVEIRSISFYVSAINVNKHYKEKEMGFIKKWLMKHKGRLPTFQNNEDAQIVLCV